MFALKVVDGLSAGIEIPLKQNGTVVIGRGAECDGVIEDQLCSAEHFEVVWSEQAGILVRDRSALNGVFVNGERVREPRNIKRGDFIQAGTTLMELGVAMQQAGQEVRASDRAPAVHGAATMMMSSGDIQEAIARTRAQARMKAKELNRTVVKTQMLTREEITRLMAEGPTQKAKTMVLQALPPELLVTANQSGLALLIQLLQSTPEDSPAVVVVKKGAQITPYAKATVTLGRDARNDIPLISDDVSGAHTRISRDNAGGFDIADEGSTNGTFVNGKRIVRQSLKHGDVVQIGSWTGPVALVGPRLAIELQREGVKVQGSHGAIKVMKADDVGATEWDPLLRERVTNVRVEMKRDRAQLLAKKKKGKSADDIAWTATSDVQRRVLKTRLGLVGLVTAPVVLLVVLGVTRLDALAPGAVAAAHATPAFTDKAREVARETSGPISRVAAQGQLSCVACHEGPRQVMVPLRDVRGHVVRDGAGGALMQPRMVSVSDETCSKCHLEVPTSLHTDAGLGCFDCHGEHNGREFSATSAAKVGCVSCHPGDPHADLFAAGEGKEARAKAPVLTQTQLGVDSFDLHSQHMSIPGRCLGCHTEGDKVVAEDARRTCGSCHAQANPERAQCVTCHVQHPRNDAALVLGNPATAQDHLKAARVDPGIWPVYLALALGMFVPIALAALLRPRDKEAHDEFVEEKSGAAASPGALGAPLTSPAPPPAFAARAAPLPPTPSPPTAAPPAPPAHVPPAPPRSPLAYAPPPAPPAPPPYVAIPPPPAPAPPPLAYVPPPPPPPPPPAAIQQVRGTGPAVGLPPHPPQPPPPPQGGPQASPTGTLLGNLAAEVTDPAKRRPQVSAGGRAVALPPEDPNKKET